jgi:hypothetical protein
LVRRLLSTDTAFMSKYSVNLTLPEKGNIRSIEWKKSTDER